MNNWLKTTVLMAAILGLFMFVGGLVGGPGGMIIAFLIGGAMNLFAYWNSDKMVLRMYDAHRVDTRTAPELYAIVQELSQRAGLPMPAVYVIDEPQPNAFATGRNPEHAAIAVTTGIMQLLTERQLRGVIAHELAHIEHRDTLISTVAATMAGAIAALANLAFFFGGRNENGRSSNPIAGLLLVILAPIAASLIQMAISRSREFAADARGAQTSGDPIALAEALQRIEAAASEIPLPVAQAHPETAQMMIMNPLSLDSVIALFRTHPKTEVRIARLRRAVADR